eukprot:m.306309 g.306309  ORF g.306309 m.306309 type:complete len:108 (+) comp16455_c2_seq21:235-558(+)
MMAKEKENLKAYSEEEKNLTALCREQQQVIVVERTKVETLAGCNSEISVPEPDLSIVPPTEKQSFSPRQKEIMMENDVLSDREREMMKQMEEMRRIIEKQQQELLRR